MESPIVETLTNFTANPSPFLEKLRQSGQPLLLAVEGASGVVLQDAEAYRAMVDRLETIAAVKQATREFREGKGRPMKDVMKEIAEKFDLQSPLR